MSMVRNAQTPVEFPVQFVDRIVEVPVTMQKQVRTGREPQKQVCSSRQMLVHTKIPPMRKKIVRKV